MTVRVLLGHKIALASIHVYTANKMVVPRSVDLKNPAENFTLPKQKHIRHQQQLSVASNIECVCAVKDIILVAHNAEKTT